MELDHEDLLVNSATTKQHVIEMSSASSSKDLHHTFDIIRVQNRSRSTLSETASDGEGADAIELSETLFAIVTFKLAQQLLYHPTHLQVFDLHHLLGSQRPSD
jgi:hypothetical protein